MAFLSGPSRSGVKYLLRQGHDGKPLYAGDKGKDVYGHEYQMLDDDKHPDAKRGPTHMTAAFYDVIPPTKIEHWLNGSKVVEYDLASEAVLAAAQKSKYKGLAGFGTKGKTSLLLQDHGNEVWFRNIRVRDLSTESKTK